MAHFNIISSQSGQAIFEGAPRYVGAYLKPGYLEFGQIGSPAPISWHVGDYVVYSRTGKTYRLYRTPQTVEQGARNRYGASFLYENVQFFDDSKQLEFCPFTDLVPGDNTIHFSTQNTVSFFGKPLNVAERVQACLEAQYGSGSWEIRIVTTSDADLLELLDTEVEFAVTGANCLEVLDKVYETWNGLGWIHGVENGVNVITIGASNVRTSANTTVPFAYDNGLVRVEKSIANADQIGTRLFAYGSMKNMDATYYRGLDIYNAESVDIEHLMIPLASWGQTGGKPDARKAYIENATAIAALGLIPRTAYFDGTGDLPDIHPTLERMTIGEVYDAGGAGYLPNLSKWSRSQRVDEIVSATNPDDHGTSAEQGQKYAESVSGTLISVSETFIDHDYFNATIFSGTLQHGGKLTLKFGRNRQVFTLGSAWSPIFNLNLSVTAGEKTQAFPLDVIRVSGTSYYCVLPESVVVSGTTAGALTVSVTGYIGEEEDASSPGGEGVFSTDVTTTVGGGLEYELSKTFTVTIPQIGFDIDDYAALGEGKTISMKTGMCAGRDFEIKGATYVSSDDSWVLTLYRSVDEDLNIMFPNADYEIAAGDQYVLLDIAMPEMYVTVASQRLLSAAQTLLADISVEQPFYAPQIDAKVVYNESRVLRDGMWMDISLDGDRQFVIIDSITIDENGSNIPTYEVALRESKGLEWTENVGRSSSGRSSSSVNGGDSQQANGSVTSVGLAAPTGMEVEGSPVTGAGVLKLKLASGYKIPLESELASYFELGSPSTLVQLKSAYSYIGTRKGLVFDTEADPTNSPAHLMVINKGTAQNPVLALYSPLPLITGGDQIVIDGDPQGGGGGGGATTLYSLLDIYGHENEVVKRADGTSRSNGDLLAFDSSKGASGMWVALPQNTIAPDLSNYYTKSQTDTEISSAITALNLGAAATYGVGSVASGNTGLVTGGSVYSAINEAVSSALKFQGITTTAISDGSTTNPITINNQSYTAKKGDVVLYDGKEYLWTGSAWEQLGDEASWALKTTTISAGTGLTGGGTLASNRTISLSQATQDSLALANTALQSHQTIYALTIKNSAGTTQLTYTPNAGTGSITLTKAMVGLGDVDNLAAADYFTALTSGSTDLLSITIGGTTKKLTTLYASRLTTVSKTIWGQTYWTENGVPQDVTAAPNLYIGTTKVQVSSAAQALTGITSITASGLIKTTNYVQATRFYLTNDIYFYTESVDGTTCVRLNAPFITSGDQIVISGTPGGGGGGGATNLKELEDVYHNASGVRRYSSGNATSTDLLGYDSTKGWYAVQLGTGLSMTNGVLTATNTSTGTVTQVKVGNTAYNPTDGVVSLPAYPTTLPASDVSAWAKASTKPSYAFSEITGTASASQIPSTVAYQSQANNFVHSTNEWTVIPSGFSGNLWLNYRTVGGTNGSLTNYSMGNGASGYASVTASSFIKNGGTSSQFLKADGSVDSNTYLTGITSTMVTNALGYTPANSTALSNYVLKAGDTMTGILTLNYTYANNARIKFVDARVTGTTGGWADSIISIHSADEALKASMGWYGNGATPEFVYFGFADYYGKNFRIYPDGTLALGNGTNGGTASQKYDIYHQGNLTKSVLTTLLESDSGYYVKKSGDTMSGALTVNSNLSATGTVTLGSESSCVLFFNRKNNPNYIWAANTGGYLAFGVADKGSTNLANSTLVVNNYGIGVGGGTTANSTAALNVTGNAVVSGSVKIGSATISWNSNGYLHIDKPLVTAGDQIVISGTPGGGGGGGATSLWGLDDVNIPHDSTYPGNGDLLSYDLSTHKWVNVAASSVGGVTSVAGRTGAITLTTSDITNIETWISGKGYITSYTDTKNTTGADNTTSKIFLVGPTAQTTSNGSARTYSNSDCYASGGYLYSGGLQVLTSHQTLYNLVINNSAGTAQITYKPGTSGTYSLTLTNAMVGLSNVENTALSTWAGTTNITTLGTITSGTWSATTIAVNKGGTGLTTWTGAYRIIYSTAATTLTTLAPNSTATRKFLRQVGANNAATAPAWDTVTKTDVGLSNVENTALSTWAGTSSITTLGTITTGVWHGSAIGNSYLANSSITINGSSTSLGGSFSTASITAGTAGQSTASTGVSFSVPYVTMNKYGIVTGYGTHTHTISASDLTTTIGSTTYAAYHAAGYVKKDGDTMTGSLTLKDASANATFVKNVALSGTTGWARSIVTLQVDGSNKFYIGAYGNYTSGGSSNGIDYAYIGVNDYNGTNLRFGSDSTLKWGTNTVWHAGNSNKSDVAWACSTLTASGNISTSGYVSVGTGGANSYVGSDAANNIFLHNSSGYVLVCDGLVVRRGSSLSTATLGSSTYPWGGVYSTTGTFSGNIAANAGITLANNNSLGGLDTGGTRRTLLSLDSGNGVYLAWGAAAAGYNSYISGDNISFLYGTGHSNGMYLNSSGNVGIGTTSPAYKLDVVGQGYFAVSAANAITLYRNTSYGVYVDYCAAAQTVKRWRVGAGTATDFYFYYSTDSGSSVTQKAYLTSAGVWTTVGDQVVSSDLTLKENLTPVNYSVSDIAKARAVEFDWKDGRGHSMGSIAQDWLGIAPALVHGEEGNMSLAYGQLALVNTIIEARAIESLQVHESEQDKEIRELRERVARLEMENKRLRMN